MLNQKQTKYIPVYVTDEHFLIISREVMQKMGWEIREIKVDSITAYTNSMMDETGENITAKKIGNDIIIESISLDPMSTGERNIKHVSRFEKKFLELNAKLSQDKLSEKYNHLEHHANQLNSKNVNGNYEFPEDRDLIQHILPKNGFIITPIIMGINILVFIIMVISGVGFMEPTSESLVNWGADFGILTLSGEWWRLWTSNYLHIGIFHLIMNMYALLYIGVLLEPYLGKVKFLTAYTLTGILASVTSVWWDSHVVSAGASGAIFGMYGVFLAMLSTNIVEKEARKSLLISIGIFVGYNLLYGLKGGVDNAAHIGGLLSGIVVGFALVPSIKNEENKLLKYGTLILLVIASFAAGYFILEGNRNDYKRHEKAMADFAVHEEIAVNNFPPEEVLPVEKNEVLNNIQEGIAEWKKCAELLHEIESMKIEKTDLDRNQKLIAYVNFRLASYELMYKKYKEESLLYDEDIINYLDKAEEILKEINTENIPSS